MLFLKFGFVFFISFFLSSLSCHFFTPVMRKLQKAGQPIREEYLAEHICKKSTPTIGGVFILFGVIFSSLPFIKILSPDTLFILSSMLFYGCIGFIDDIIKVKKIHHSGLSGKVRIITQLLFSGLSIFLYIKFKGEAFYPGLQLFGAESYYKLSILAYVLIAALGIFGCSNAFNITDGLDGLLSSCILPICVLLNVIGFYESAGSLYGAPPDHQNVLILNNAIAGATLGFLWFNAPKASIFMGDTGSLALGAALASISIVMRHELCFMIACGLIEIEAASTILQILSYKSRKKRIFLMAPLHHHFEKLGWSESKIVFRFKILSILFCALSALSYFIFK